MWDQVLKCVTDYRLGDLASIVGLLVAIIGFCVTIISVVRSKKAAERAEDAALQVRQDIAHFETVVDFAAALSSIDEIKRLNREGAWRVLPDRYAALRKALISIRKANPGLSSQHQTHLQSAIQHCSLMEGQVERALEAQSAPPRFTKLNEILSQQADHLNEILVEIKMKIGR